MLNPNEQQISISAGLLHSFEEINGYLLKVIRNMEDSPTKKDVEIALRILEMFEKAEMITLKNWCKHE